MLDTSTKDRLFQKWTTATTVGECTPSIRRKTLLTPLPDATQNVAQPPDGRAVIVNFKGLPFAVMFPGALDEKTCQNARNSVLDYVRAGFLNPVADHTHGHYIDVKPTWWKDDFPPLKGVAYLSYAKHPQGHANYPSIVSRMLVSTCSRFEAGMQLLGELAPAADTANFLMDLVDSPCYNRMAELREKIIKKRFAAKAICHINPSVHTNLGVIVNRQSGAHYDPRDAIDVWDVMFAVGNFTGGRMRFARDGAEYTTTFSPGDAIVLKARHVEHEVLDFEGDIRITLAFFTHEGIMQEFNI